MTTNDCNCQRTVYVHLFIHSLISLFNADSFIQRAEVLAVLARFVKLLDAPFAHDSSTLAHSYCFVEWLSENVWHLIWCYFNFYLFEARQEQSVFSKGWMRFQNLTAIVDVLSNRCFLKDLERNLVAPPTSLIDLVEKMEVCEYGSTFSFRPPTEKKSFRPPTEYNFLFWLPD